MDFLTFKSFISINVLILFYYVGAIIIPLFAWTLATWFLRNYHPIDTTYQQIKKSLWKHITTQQKIYLLLFFIFGFFFMELLWRMMFEFLIAYLQIRDALVT